VVVARKLGQSSLEGIAWQAKLLTSDFFLRRFFDVSDMTKNSEGGPQLRRDSLGLAELVFQAITHIAPATSGVFIFPATLQFSLMAVSSKAEERETPVARSGDAR
jgi:hypothetical protein